MYSYAFIFYVEEDNQVYIIETNLDDLEAKTDTLSVHLEQYFKRTPDEFYNFDEDETLETDAEIRVKIVDGVA